MLINQLREYLSWLRDHALPGFRDASADMYDTEEDYITVEESLLYSSLEMKKCVERNDQENFDRFKAKYTRLFDHVNKNIALTMFEETMDKYLEKGHVGVDAEKYALEELWEDPKLRYYLPAQAILKHQDGREVFLVANERHIPQDNLYVLTSELEYLQSSGLDPWDYVTNRRANENITSAV